MTLKKLVCAFFTFVLLFGNVDAQLKKLTLDQALNFGAPRLVKFLPRSFEWISDTEYLANEGNIIKINALSGERSIYRNLKEWNTQLPEGIQLSRPESRSDDYNSYILEKENDLYFFDIEKEVFKRLTNDEAVENNVRFSPDSKFAAYTKGKNLFVYDIEREEEIQLTSDGSETIYNGWASWVYYEEILGRASRYAAFWWSPNNDKVAFLRFDDSPVPEFTLVDSKKLHGRLEVNHYPKPGDPNPKVKLGIADVKTKKVTWVDLDYTKDKYVAWPFWTPDGNELLFQWMNRGQDTLKIYAANPNDGSKRLVYEESQDSWVEFFEDIYFVNDGKECIITSDKNGWNHIYHFDLKGNLINQITDGKLIVKGIEKIDEENEVIYFHAEDPDLVGERHLYVVDFDGSGLEKLTNINGYHSCSVSKNSSYYLDRFSSINEPTRIDLFDADGEMVKEIDNSKLPIYDEYDLGKTEIFTIETSDGMKLQAKWTLPSDFDENKKYPVIMSVYGGPGAASVRNSTSMGYSSEFMAQHGIITLTVDHRGTGHHGKKGEALMHRNLGKWEMNDYIEAVKWLKKKPFIDTTKIGITGGSYGGYVTCMALTYGADYFTHGIAHFSVTDWRLYDNVYTERYMDTPEENPDGYDFANAMNYVDKYKGKLLITHGSLDDNVHMQNTLRFVDEMLNKNKDFEMMIYPGERHGYGFSKRYHFTKMNVGFWFENFLGIELD